jgi:hypothetical protein
MTPITVRPTRADLSVAKIVSAHTGHEPNGLRKFSPGARTNMFCARSLSAGGFIVGARMQRRDAQVTTFF